MMSVSNGNNDIGLCDMEKLNEVVLGSEVAILTGMYLIFPHTR